MKRYALLSSIFFLLLTSCSSTSIVPQRVMLQDGWTLQNSRKLMALGKEISSENIDVSGWYEATVPSTVMGILTKNGLYPDIFMGNNIAGIDTKQFDSSWWYRKEFMMQELTTQNYVHLHFDGISYYANIWLNGNQVASKENVYGSFRQFDFDITGLLKKGKNVLAVEVFRQRPGDFGIGFVDWNPRPPDESMGIWREVYLTLTDAVSIQHSVVDSKINLKTLDEASLTIKTELVNHSDRDVSALLKGTIETIEFEYPVNVAPHETKLLSLSEKDVAALHLKNPRLWWCNNLGDPNLYKLNLRVEVNNRVSDSTSFQFGIREIKDFYDSNGYRGFTLNGKKVLIKGGGWTDDIFLRDTRESIDTQIQYVKDMNLNTIRLENVWGTSQNMYNACDKYGIMVMVGWTCHWEWEVYIGKPCDDFGGIQTEDEMTLMTASLKDQVQWLRYHPSIISWFVGSDKLPRPTLEKKYKQLLATLDDRPYLACASSRKSDVSGSTGVKMNGPYEYEGPNYWYIDKDNGGAFGFNTETGPGPQIPEKETLLKIIPKDKLWPLNASWNFHCTSAKEAFNTLDVFNEAVDARLGKSKDLDDYILKASITQYEAMRAMFEAFRVNQSKTTGIVQWMLNSAWPSLYWHLYDYYQLPTSAYYATKKANEPLQLIYNYGDNFVYGVNESREKKSSLVANVRAFDIRGKNLFSVNVKFSVDSLTSCKIQELEKFKGVVFLALELYDDNNKLIATNFYWLSEKPDEYKWNKTTWAYTPMKSYADFKEFSTMPESNVSLIVEKKRQGAVWLVDVTLKNAGGIAFFSKLELKDSSGALIKPIFWSDNYVSLIPQESRHIQCRISDTLITKVAELVFSGWNSPRKIVSLK